MSHLVPLLQSLVHQVPLLGSYKNEGISAATLVMHAKAYILADRYCISFLKQLAFQKLHRRLITSYFGFDEVDHVSQLIRYAWANTRSDGYASRDDNHGGDKDELRHLLISFSACTFKEFMLVDSFRDVLHDHSEISTAILEVMSKLKVPVVE